MLTRLEANDIVAMWQVIEEGVKRSFDPELLSKEGTSSRLLKKLLDGSIVAWLSRRNIDALPSGIILTSILSDDVVNERALLIYMMSTFGIAPQAQEWTEAAEGIRKYGKSVRCKRVVFYTRNQKLIRFFSSANIGITTSYFMCTIDL